jgi:hypothetical protein
MSLLQSAKLVGVEATLSHAPMMGWIASRGVV